MIGINDIAKGKPRETLESSLEKLFLCMVEAKITNRVIVQSILPSARPVHEPALIRSFNTFLQSRCDTLHIRFLDIHPHFKDTNRLLPKTLFDDGLHLNNTGYHQMESNADENLFFNIVWPGARHPLHLMAVHAFDHLLFDAA
jgi:lysophospholipase L1-like esterase